MLIFDHPVFFAYIQAFSIFTKHHQVDISISAFDMGHAFGRADVTMGLEFFSQCNIDGSETGSDRGCKRPFKGNAVLLESIQRLVRQGRSEERRVGKVLRWLSRETT